MEWEPEQQDLGGLGFAGICRETCRVLLRAILPHTKGGMGAAILSVLLVAHPLFFRAILGADNGPIVFLFLEMVFLCVLFHISLICTAGYVFRVASLYCTDGDFGATDRILRNLPRAPLKRFYCTFINVVTLTMSMAWPFLIGLACLLMLRLDKVVLLPLLWVLFSVCLAGTAYLVVVSHIACVVAVLEEAVLFDALRKSRALLAGKFLAAAAVFVPLDGCFAALQIYSVVLTFEDRMGLAAGAVMAVALWAVVVLTMVAQPVVYMVCKNHHHEVVDKVHLNYVGEYQQLAVDDESGVELQPVETMPQPTATSVEASPQPLETTPQPTATSAQASPQPAVLPST